MLLSRSQLIREIEETREKLRELEETLEMSRIKKFRIVLEVETNTVDWNCDEDEISSVLQGYVHESLNSIKDLIQLGDPDDKLILKSFRETED